MTRPTFGTLILLVAGAAGLAALPASEARAQDGDPTEFLRGDANADGFASTADAVMIRRWLFSFGPGPTCRDTADADDDGRINLDDEVFLIDALFSDWSTLLPAPFPAPGPDPTEDEEPGFLNCEAYSPTAASHTEDRLLVGEVEAVAGDIVEIPIYLQASVPIDAVQVVLTYDPDVLEVLTGANSAFSFEGAYLEQFFGVNYTAPEYPEEGDRWPFERRGPVVDRVVAYPDLGIIAVGVVTNILFTSHEFPPDQEILVGSLRARAKPGTDPGTIVDLKLTNGEDDAGIGPYRIRNELTYLGEARYATIVPETIDGRFAVVPDVTFFRGDSNGDRKLELSDAVFTLNHLFLGGQAPACPDAADTNDDGVIELTDAVVLLNMLFLGTGRVAPPYPDAGLDETADSLPRCQPASN